jgi:hypothetical protein
MYVLILLIKFDFLMKILTTVSSENPKNIKVTETDQTIHQSTQFSVLIQNMTF